MDPKPSSDQSQSAYKAGSSAPVPNTSMQSELSGDIDSLQYAIDQGASPTRSVPVPPPSGNLPKHGHKALKALAIIIIAIVIICAAAYGVLAFVISPDSALSKAMNNAISDRSAHTTMSVTVASSDPSSSATTINIVGDADKTDPKNPSVQASMSVATNGFSGAIDMKIINKVVYARVTKMPTIFSAYSSMIGDSWYSLSMDALNKFASSTGSSANIMGAKLSPDAMFSDLMSKGVVSSPKFVGLTNRSGEMVRQYSIAIDKDKMLSWAMSIQATQTGNAYTAQAQQMTKEMSKDLAIGDINIYVGLLDGSMRGSTIDMSVTEPTVAGSTKAPATYNVHFDYSYKGSSSGISIAVPQGAKSMDSYLTSYLASAKQNTPSQQIPAIVSGSLGSLRAAYEKDYTGSFKGVCLKAEGMGLSSYETEVSRLGSSLVCHDNATAFVMYAQLPIEKNATSASYYCVDSTGKSATLPHIPASLSCK